MSGGKEVKRFYFVPTGEKDVFGSPTFVCHDKSLNGDDWFMPVEDHDRIVAELKARIEKLEAALTEVRDYGAPLDGFVAVSMKEVAREALTTNVDERGES